MKIAVIGAGGLGGAVGRAWLEAGHEVLFSSRHPYKQQRAAAALGPLVSGGSIDKAADFGAVVLIAVPYNALEALGQGVPLASDDPAVLHVAERLVRDADFDPVTVGDLTSARRFQSGGAGFRAHLGAPALRRALSLH